MKSALTALMLTIVAIPALADEGNLTQTHLDQLGLGSIQIMTDADGMAIRGTGGKHGKHGKGGSFAFVLGVSQVAVNIGGSSAASVDGAAAGSVNKYKGSAAAQAHGSTGLVITPVGSSFAIAGGFSAGKAGGKK